MTVDEFIDNLQVNEELKDFLRQINLFVKENYLPCQINDSIAHEQYVLAKRFNLPAMSYDFWHQSIFGDYAEQMMIWQTVIQESNQSPPANMTRQQVLILAVFEMSVIEQKQQGACKDVTGYKEYLKTL